MNLVLFTHQDLSDVPIHKWVDCEKNRVFVIADAEEQKNDDIEPFLAFGYAEVRLYSNYVNNGAIDAYVLDLSERCHLDRLIAIGRATSCARQGSGRHWEFRDSRWKVRWLIGTSPK